jgi:hypothetical protein
MLWSPVFNLDYFFEPQGILKSWYSMRVAATQDQLACNCRPNCREEAYELLPAAYKSSMMWPLYDCKVVLDERTKLYLKFKMQPKIIKLYLEVLLAKAFTSTPRMDHSMLIRRYSIFEYWYPQISYQKLCNQNQINFNFFRKEVFFTKR